MERGVQLIYELAVTMVKNNQYLNAWDVTQQIIKLDEKHAYAHNLLGLVQEKYFEDIEGARQYYAKAYYLDQNNIQIIVNYSKVLLSLGELDEVESLSKKMQEMKGISPFRILWLQSSIQEMRKNFVEARRLIKEAIKLVDHNKKLNEMLETAKRLDMKIKAFGQEV